MLIAQGLVLEEVGGDVQSVPVSALKGTGLQELIETINTQATLLDLKADVKGMVEATVVESRTDPSRGYHQNCAYRNGQVIKLFSHSGSFQLPSFKEELCEKVLISLLAQLGPKSDPCLMIRVSQFN